MEDLLDQWKDVTLLSSLPFFGAAVACYAVARKAWRFAQDHLAWCDPPAVLTVLLGIAGAASLGTGLGDAGHHLPMKPGEYAELVKTGKATPGQLEPLLDTSRYAYFLPPVRGGLIAVGVVLLLSGVVVGIKHYG